MDQDEEPLTVYLLALIAFISLTLIFFRILGYF